MVARARSHAGLFRRGGPGGQTLLGVSRAGNQSVVLAWNVLTMPESPQEKLRPSPQVPQETFAPAPFEYAELDVTTNFSFLRGASHPDELMLQAARLGHRAIAITDLNSLAGAVRMYDAARQIAKTGWAPKLIIGARLAFSDAPDMLVWAPDRAADARLFRLLTLGRRRAPKGECSLKLADFLKHCDGLLAGLVP